MNDNLSAELRCALCEMAAVKRALQTGSDRRQAYLQLVKAIDQTCHVMEELASDAPPVAVL